MSDEIRLDDCGCCGLAGDSAPPGRQADNPPGLDAVTFRAGDYGSFLRGMLETLASSPDDAPTPATRDPDDPANALLDAAAVVGDVLTFYNERLANEAFLRTAAERLSVLQLARAIGYEMKPGVAASAYLTFEMAAVDPAASPMPGAHTPGAALAPKEVRLDPGIQVMSVPQGNEPPQVFETLEAIRARADWNALRPRLTWPQVVPAKEEEEEEEEEGEEEQEKEEELVSLHFEGSALNIKPGDVILFVGYQVTKEDGSKVLELTCPEDSLDEDGQCTHDITAFARPVHAVVVDDERGTTLVDFSAVPDPAPAPPRPPKIRQLDFDLKIGLTQQAIRTVLGKGAIAGNVLRNYFRVQRWNFQVVQDQARTKPKPPPTPPGVGIFIMRARTGFFGNNAPRWESLPKPDNLRGGVCRGAADPFPHNWDTDKPSIWQNSRKSPWTELGLVGDVYLDRSLPEMTGDGWVVFDDAEAGGVRFKPFRVTGLTETSIADYAISAKVTGLNLQNPDGTSHNTTENNFRARTATAYVQSEKLTLAEVPILDPVKSGEPLELDRLDLYLTEGQAVALSGTRVDLDGVTSSEILTIASIEHPHGRTELTLVDAEGNLGPEHEYERESVRINANVALATHGETVREVLGSGDGSQANQRFSLKRPPLTYISSAGAGGVATTLTVRVNEAAWTEVPSLYEAGPQDQVYIVRHDDAGVTTLTFGDGIHGARLPTGANNVTAVYRTGIGAAGAVEAGTLTMLMTKPLGVQGVVNPLAAGGEAEPETLDSARQAAPAAVKTLDRIVSLRDYEDLARIFAGVSKARATVIWRKDPVAANRLRTARAVVHLTVASTTGDPLEGTPVLANLRAAIDARRDPGTLMHIADYDPRTFYLKAKLLRDPRYEFEVVQRAALDALTASFSFAARELTQPVSAAEVIACLSAVTGVIAMDLDELDYSVLDAETPPVAEPPRPILIARPARWDEDQRVFLPAQLLHIDPLGVSLDEKK